MADQGMGRPLRLSRLSNEVMELNLQTAGKNVMPDVEVVGMSGMLHPIQPSGNTLQEPIHDAPGF